MLLRVAVHMAFETLFVVIKLVTSWKLAMVFGATFFSQMSLFMNFKVIGGTEFFWAVRTLEGLFTSVDLLVSLQVGNLKKLS